MITHVNGHNPLEYGCVTEVQGRQVFRVEIRRIDSHKAIGNVKTFTSTAEADVTYRLEILEVESDTDLSRLAKDILSESELWTDFCAENSDEDWEVLKNTWQTIKVKWTSK